MPMKESKSESEKNASEETEQSENGTGWLPKRKRLPDERNASTHKFVIHADQRYKGYITIGTYDDGTLGEMFIRIDKIGSLINGLLDAVAITVSIGLQYGIPLEVFVRKFAHMRFYPDGPTDNPDIPFTKSLPDYIFRWLAIKFLDKDTVALWANPQEGDKDGDDTD